MSNPDPKEKSVRQYYNQFANKYEDIYLKIQETKFSEIQLINPFEPSGWVIDLGGGTGLLSHWLGYNCLTIDISIEMLHYGMQRKRPGLPIVADMRFLPLRTKSVDKIYSITAIQNSSDIMESLFEISRVNLPDAETIITILKKSFSGAVKNVCNSVFPGFELHDLLSEDILILLH